MTTPAKPKKNVSPLVRYYLVLYNAAQFAGWSWLLILMIQHILKNGLTQEKLWDEIGQSLKIFQTGALFEILHSLIGIVPSSIGVTLPQVFSRFFVLWPILVVAPEAQASIGLPCLLVAWVVTEVIRYLFYVLALFDAVPQLLRWCRYSFFLVLYPMGVTGELLCCFAALPLYDATQKYSVNLPNKLNFTFSFYYFVVVFMLFYFPVFPKLFGHMLAQRRKVLGGGTKQD